MRTPVSVNDWIKACCKCFLLYFLDDDETAIPEQDQLGTTPKLEAGYYWQENL